MKTNDKSIIRTMDNQSDFYHIPALLEETIHGLSIRPAGIYVDVTFGGGGHSKEILKHLNPNGRLYAFDQDEDAENFCICHVRLPRGLYRRRVSVFISGRSRAP